MLKVRAAECQDVRNCYRKRHEQNFPTKFQSHQNETANHRSTFGPLTGFKARRYVAQDNLEMFWPCQEGGVCTVWTHDPKISLLTASDRL